LWSRSPAKARTIAIPVDLDSQVNTLSLKVHSNMVQRAAKDWRISARTRPRKETFGGPDYKNIIEKLQVDINLQYILCVCVCVCVCETSKPGVLCLRSIVMYVEHVVLN